MPKRTVLVVAALLCFSRISLGVEYSGKIRYRIETFRNYNLYEKLRQSESAREMLHFLRADIRADYTFGNDDNKLHLELRTAQTSGNGNADTAFKPGDTVRLHQAYVSASGVFGRNTTLQIGRQELRYGRELLVGADDWDNLGRDMDAVKFSLNGDTWDIDAFWAWVFDPTTSYRDGTFAGLNFKHTNTFKTVKEFFAYYRYMPYLAAMSKANLRIFNLGTRTEGKISNSVFYHWMLNWQTGRTLKYEPLFNPAVRQNHRAYNYQAQIDFFAGGSVIRNLGVEYSVSSGDKAHTDSRHETFFPMFPSDHPHSGAMDWFGYMNSEIVTFYTFYDMTPTVNGLIEFHRFHLNSGGAAWYLGNLKPAWTGASGPSPSSDAAPRDAGAELDFLWRFRPRGNTSYHLGYSVFFPGNLPKHIKWWNTSKSASWAYFQVETRF
ncbi:MAG: alginate export family protein [bacterium]